MKCELKINRLVVVFGVGGLIEKGYEEFFEGDVGFFGRDVGYIDFFIC